MNFKTAILIFTALLVISGNRIFAQTEYHNLTKEKQVLKDQLPVRATRKTAVWFDIGWNGLTGIGPVITTYAAPKLGIDYGIGISSEGVKLSGRARYLFSIKNFTPFAGLGFMYGFGSKTDFELTDYENNDAKYRVLVKESPFLQLSAGFEYMAKKGFFTIFNIGYAIVLTNNYEITSGNPVSATKQMLNFVYGSGMVIEGGIGYAF